MSKTTKFVIAGLIFFVAIALGVLVYIFYPREQSTLVMSVPTTVTTTTTTTVITTTEVTTEPTTYPVYDEYTASANGITDKAAMLLKQNKDITGWLKIDGTYVDYPVFKDPGEIPAGVEYYNNEPCAANEFYLHHDINGNYKFEGVLYMDYRDNFGGVESEQSENIIIYGHNMMNNTMFGSLRWFRQQPTYYQQYPFIELSSNYKDYDYVIVAWLITGGNWYSDFIYWDMEELDNESDFNYYMDCVREKQLVDTGIDVKYGDKLLTLSTCYADEDNSRFLVIARRLREGESTDDYSTIQRTGE